MTNQVANNECQENKSETNTGTNTNKVGIRTSKSKSISFITNSCKDQHNEDQDQLHDPEDTLEGAEVVVLPPH